MSLVKLIWWFVFIPHHPEEDCHVEMSVIWQFIKTIFYIVASSVDYFFSM